MTTAFLFAALFAFLFLGMPIAVALAEPRTDRYLVSVGLNRLTPTFDGKALFVGYGFKNRIDVQIGGIEHDGFSPWVLTTFRF